MEKLAHFWILLLHLDQNLERIINLHPYYVYGILFTVIFLEMAFLFASFLPGDSLLFIAGTFASRGSLDFLPLLCIFTLAAVIGNTINYFIGIKLGPMMFRKEKAFFFKKERIAEAHRFFERYGSMALVFSFFVPILRTIASFAAGIAEMDFKKFMLSNGAGSFAWIMTFLAGGFLFGLIPVVRRNSAAGLFFTGLVILVLIPVFIRFYKMNGKEPGRKDNL